MNDNISYVESWYESNTFDCRFFDDLQILRELKIARKLRVSVCLPTLNEQETLPGILTRIKNELVDTVGLVDEIVVIDSGSTDGTCELAGHQNVPVFYQHDVLKLEGTREGKGESLWKSLHVLQGEIIVWIDTDIRNFHPCFVYGLLGPILHDARIVFTKAFYRRPLRIGSTMIPDAGGRVTELTVRPLINLLFPELSFFIQPLAGEFAMLRQVAEQIPFSAGYAVDVGMLVDILHRYGLHSMAQVGMGERIHRNRDLQALSQEAFEICRCLLVKASMSKAQIVALLGTLPRSLIQFSCKNNEFVSAEAKLNDHERPPMATVSEYVRRHKSRES